MILVRLMGGLGNQMFQYAFAKSVSIRKGTELKIDLSLLGEQDKKIDNLVVRHFDLDVFHLDTPIASQNEVELYNGSSNPKLSDRLKFKLNRFFYKYKLVIQKENEFNQLQLANIEDNSCVVGRWQSELFFEEYKAQIKKLYNFNSFTPNQFSVNVSRNIMAETSVGIHVRRGDYVTNPIYSEGIGALSVQYYYDAIEILKNKLSEPNTTVTYYFISDDIEWCKKTFSRMRNVQFVEQEKTKTGYVSDMWLMTLCKHIIISNSTFAWWGAYLGEKNDGIIIAPKIWAKKKNFTPDNIIPKRWLTITNTFEA